MDQNNCKVVVMLGNDLGTKRRVPFGERVEKTILKFHRGRVRQKTSQMVAGGLRDDLNGSSLGFFRLMVHFLGP